MRKRILKTSECWFKELAVALKTSRDNFWEESEVLGAPAGATAVHSNTLTHTDAIHLASFF